MAKSIKNSFPLSGLACAACAARVEKVLNGAEGVTEASVNFATSTANVEYNPETVSPQDLQKLVQEAGYDMVIDEALMADADRREQEANQHYRSLRNRTIWAIVLSLPVFIVGMFFMNMPFANLIMLVFSTPVVFWFGRQFFIGAWKQLRHRTANMDTLVALSTGIAWLFSVANMLFPEWWMSKGIHPHVYFEASSIIIAFILLGRLLEGKARANTSTAVKKLMGLRPKTVMKFRPDGQSVEIQIEDLSVGDIVVVRPGERVAVDGTVIEGESYVDELMLSGEPLPVRKEKGVKVFAGTINGNGSFRFTADKVGEDTLLARIIRMVQDAQGSKAPVQKLVDKIAAIFVPTIIAISLVAFFCWLFLAPSEGFSHGLLAAITVLVIACPCALGLATPTAIMVGVGKGAEDGILVKDAESFEIAPKINAIVLDKTGTITEGRPSVTEYIDINGSEESMRVLLSLEMNSEHPLAQAVTTFLSDIQPVKITSFVNVPGHGVKGEYKETSYYVGNRKLLESNNVSISAEISEKARALADKGISIVWFASADKVISMLGVSDMVKASSAEAIDKLEKTGLEVYMLTGDNKTTAEAVGRAAGIKHVVAETLPQDKADFVKKLQKSGKKVAMVGDGINDSAALAAADLSIAMGTGSDIAIEVAKLTIVSGDLMKLPVAIRLSKATIRTVRQNLFWAFIYNVIGIPLAAGVLYPVNGFLLNPMIAGAAMAFSSVSVVTNSLLLRFKKI